MMLKWNIEGIKMSFLDEKEGKMLFQKLQFYNGVIEKQRIKHFKNIDLLYELPFYDELSIAKISQTFRRYVKI